MLGLGEAGAGVGTGSAVLAGLTIYLPDNKNSPNKVLIKIDQYFEKYPSQHNVLVSLE